MYLYMFKEYILAIFCIFVYSFANFKLNSEIIII